MPTDLSLDIRQAIVAHLRMDADLTALVPVSRIYSEFATFEPADIPPTFIRMGYSDMSAFEATGWSGSEGTFTIHAFANGPGTDAISTIAKRVQRRMETFNPQNVDGGWSEWRRTIVIPDDSPHRLHAVITFDVSAVETD